MRIETIKTRIIDSNDSLEKILDEYVINLKEDSIITISSKIISICQGRVKRKSQISKQELIRQEADKVLHMGSNAYGIYLTITNNILIPSAGIDESNANDFYILYPQDPQQDANDIWQYLRGKNNIKNLGVIITDSHSTIMRRGLTGFALSWCGFEPLYSYIGKPDIYNRALQFSAINLPDSLASSAVLMMGEGNEQTPIAIITDAPKITFVDRVPTTQEKQEMRIKMEDDIYAPLLMSCKWTKKR